MIARIRGSRELFHAYLFPRQGACQQLFPEHGGHLPGRSSDEYRFQVQDASLVSQGGSKHLSRKAVPVAILWSPAGRVKYTGLLLGETIW